MITSDTDIRQIKHLFMTYRNGIVSDTLRKAGQPYAVIFGLQIPQISEIARQLSPSAALARTLWADTNVRESRLLACWIFPVEELLPDEALAMALSVITREEADILAFRLLRRHPEAGGIPDMITAAAKTPLQRYAAEALRRNLE